MPWWASTYFAAYLTFSLWSLRDDLRNQDQPMWHMAAEIAMDLCLVIAALSFWVPAVRAFAEPALGLLYLFGTLMFSVLFLLSLRKQLLLDRELPIEGKWFVGISGSVLVALVTAPLLYFGFVSTILGRFASA